MRYWLICSLLTAVLATNAVAEDSPPREPEARKTWVAERREEALKRREEFLKLPVAEQEAIRAERHAKRDKRRGERGDKESRVRTVDVRTLPSTALSSGAPAGESCSTGKSCTLRLQPPAGQVVVVTAVWSATRVECDGVRSATPPNGAPIAPGWRCARELVVEGPGAGYVGFLAGP